MHRLFPSIIMAFAFTTALGCAEQTAAEDEDVGEQEGAATESTSSESRWAGRFSSGTTDVWLYHVDAESSRVVGGVRYTRGDDVVNATLALGLESDRLARSTGDGCILISNPPDREMTIGQPRECQSIPAQAIAGRYTRRGDAYAGVYERDATRPAKADAPPTIDVRRSGRDITIRARIGGTPRELKGTLEDSGWQLRLRGAGCSNGGAAAVFMGGRINISAGCGVDGLYAMK